MFLKPLTTLLYPTNPTTLRIILLAALLLRLSGQVAAQAGETYIYPGTTGATDFTVGNINSDTVVVTASFFNSSNSRLV